MPWVDVAAAATLAIAAVLGIGGRDARKAWANTAMAVSAALLVAAVAIEGLRWQVLGLAAVGVLVAGLSLRSRRRGLRRLLRGVSLIMTTGMFTGLGLAAWALPPASVPRPSGEHSVGVTVAVYSDARRSERGGEGDGTSRSLPVTIWYPAATTGSGGPLIASDSETVVGGLAEQYGLPSWIFQELRDAHGHASPNAALADGSFPVVLFSPGLGSSRWLASSWATEVASNGAVVVAVDHPYDAAATVLADGAIARSELVATGDDEEDNRNAAEWTKIRATDLSAVLDEITARQGDDPALAGADVRHVVVAGHSLGGAAALLAASNDSRIGGVVDIDGMPRSPVSDRSIPTIVLVAGDADPNPRYAEATNALVAAGGKRVTVPGVAHLGFTDLSLIVAPIPTIVGADGGAGRRSAAAATLAVLTAVRTATPLDAADLASLGNLD